jgi:hypothetical protein
MSVIRHLAIVLAISAATLSAQAPRTGGTALVSAEQIVARAGSDRDAATLVQQALRLFLPGRARNDDGTVVVLLLNCVQIGCQTCPECDGCV